MGNPAYYCVICEHILENEEPGDLKQFTDEPCAKCKHEMEEGNFLFVLISDKSDENRINRLHQTYVVPEEEVIKEYGSLEQFNGEQIVFITESEALHRGLLDERITDAETGLKLEDMDQDNTLPPDGA